MLVALAALAPPSADRSLRIGGQPRARGREPARPPARGGAVGRWAGGAGLGGAGRHRRPALRRATVLDDGRVVLRGRRGQRRRQRSRTPRRSRSRCSHRRTAAWCWPRSRLCACSAGSAGGTASTPSRLRATGPATGGGRARGGPALPDGGRRRARRHGVDRGARGRPVPHADARRRRRAARRWPRALLGFPLPAKPTWSTVRCSAGCPTASRSLSSCWRRALCRGRAGPATSRRPVAGRAQRRAGAPAWRCSRGRPSAASGSTRTCCSAPTWSPHMLLSMVAPIGLVLGAPVTLALRALPGPRVPGELGPRQLLLAVLHSRGRAGRHASARRVRVVRRQPLRPLLHVAVRHPDEQPSRARR